MKKNNLKAEFLLGLIIGFAVFCFNIASAQTQDAILDNGQENAASKAAEEAVVDNLTEARNVTLDFQEADIRNVLKIISYKSGANIVTTPEVIGNVTIRLVDVPWDKALDVILRTHGFGYEKQGNIITVAPIEKLTELKRQEVELAQVQPTLTEVFNLKYIDAQDAKKAIEPQLSARGRVTVLEMTGQSGWEFGTTELAKRKRTGGEESMGRSKVLIVSDIPPALDKIREVIDIIDVKQVQVLIETKFIEVSKDRLRDIGVDWGSGKTGAESSTVQTVIETDRGGETRSVSALGAQSLSSIIEPSSFDPKSAITGTNPYAAGLEFVWQKLTGAQFEVILHALEEDVHSNTLSAPRIMAMNNQEASILVGTKYPIVSSEVSTETTGTVSVSLEYYQDIGIQLNVVPQVGSNNSINMVVHPAVTSFTETVGGTDVSYPIINTREAETRVLMNDGETIVIGGLLKDIKVKGVTGVPFLKDIPLLGALFRRNTQDDEKVELLIFISAHIVKEGDFSEAEIKKLENKLGREGDKFIEKKKR